MEIINRRLFSVVLCMTLCSLAAADNVIVIIRHGEKPANGLGQLSCQGLNRALALAPLVIAKYGWPSALYAPNPALKKKDSGIQFFYVRPLATIEPLAIRAGLPVNLDWGMKDIKPLADALILPTEGVQVVAWEHHWAESLSKRLLQKTGSNPKQVPEWKDQDFDSIYIIHISTDARGKTTSTFSLEAEGLNGQPDQCPR